MAEEIIDNRKHAVVCMIARIKFLQCRLQQRSRGNTHGNDVIGIDLWAAATGILLFFGIKKLHGLRVGKRVEEEGLDIYEHGESCYNV